jgi:hypothetical protein
MVTSPSYAKLVSETQEQAVKTLESGFEFASRLLELQKRYTLGVAGLVVAATPSAQD